MTRTSIRGSLLLLWRRSRASTDVRSVGYIGEQFVLGSWSATTASPERPTSSEFSEIPAFDGLWGQDSLTQAWLSSAGLVPLPERRGFVTLPL